MNGATTDPSATTNRKPINTKKNMIGESHSFFRVFKKITISIKKLIVVRLTQFFNRADCEHIRFNNIQKHIFLKKFFLNSGLMLNY